MKTPEQFKIVLKSLKGTYPRLASVIGAQLALESNFGRSPLAREARNFAGLGYRDLSSFLPGDVWARVGVYKYTGQDGDTKKYLKCYKPGDFVTVYMAFLRRGVYIVGGISTQELLNNPLTFLAWIADNGFCGWVPNIKIEDYPAPGEYKEATHAEYVRSVLECSLSHVYRKLLREL